MLLYLKTKLCFVKINFTMYVTKKTLNSANLTTLDTFTFNDVGWWKHLKITFYTYTGQISDLIYFDAESDIFHLEKVRYYTKMDVKLQCRTKKDLHKILSTCNLTSFARIAALKKLIKEEDAENLRCFLVDTFQEMFTDESKESVTSSSTPIASNWEPPVTTDAFPTYLKHYEKLVATGSKLLNEYKSAAERMKHEKIEYPGYEDFINFELACTKMSIEQLEPLVNCHREQFQKLLAMKASLAFDLLSREPQ